ncbi:MAG: gamma-glutamylcyclotransferase [Pseudomonadota bacterium]
MTLWVFGYGSLLWHPGFDIAESVVATLPGYARSFCMRSIHHRGTEDAPGLVLALDHQPGAACVGMAFRVMPAQEQTTLAYLRERELISSAYVEHQLDVDLRDGRRVQALVYVVDEAHVQYCGGLALEDQAQIIAFASGGRGPNAEYLNKTADHLRAMGLADPQLDWLQARVQALNP